MKAFKDRMAGWLGERAPIKQLANSVCHSGSSIFLFHRVLPSDQRCFQSELSTGLAAFSSFLDWIGDSYQVVSLDELVTRSKEATKRKVPLCAITFDDGWIDNYTYAFPELARRKMPATIFLPLQFIGTNRRFWQELVAIFVNEIQKDHEAIAALELVARHSPWFPPLDAYREDYGALRRLLLTRPGREAQEFAERMIEAAGLTEKVAERAFVNWDEVKHMQQNGMSFASHTMNHIILNTASPAAGEKEICTSRRLLQERLNTDVRGFSYPWGSVGPNSIEQVQKTGYQYAVTVRPGVIKPQTHPFLLPRIPISNSILNGGFDAFSPGKARISFSKNILQNRSNVPLRGTNLSLDKRVKIIFVLDVITEWEGGTERQLHRLIQSLDRRYFEPKLCFLFEASQLPPQTLPCPLIVVSPAKEGRLIGIQRFFKLVEILKAEQPDIVQTFFREGIFGGVSASRIAGVPKIIISIRNAGTWQNALHRFVLGCVGRFASHWQTNSRALWVQEFQRHKMSPNEIEILPNGIDLSHFSPPTPEERADARRTLNLRKDSFICLSVANLTAIKDIPTLLEGARLVKESMPLCQFLIVGDGELRPELEQHAVRLGINGSVRFCGRKSDVRPFLAAADVGVLTSRSEGSSNSVIEYMAAGLPTILSDIQPNRELTDGVFFRSGDSTDFANKIILLARDTGFSSRLSRANLTMAQEFDMSRFNERAQGYYYKLASEISRRDLSEGDL